MCFLSVSSTTISIIKVSNKGNVSRSNKIEVKGSGVGKLEHSKHRTIYIYKSLYTYNYITVLFTIGYYTRNNVY